eukprot:350706-Chlamydomonas_euryale.AAC.2
MHAYRTAGMILPRLRPLSPLQLTLRGLPDRMWTVPLHLSAAAAVATAAAPAAAADAEATSAGGVLLLLRRFATHCFCGHGNGQLCSRRKANAGDGRGAPMSDNLLQRAPIALAALPDRVACSSRHAALLERGDVVVAASRLGDGRGGGGGDVERLGKSVAGGVATRRHDVEA